MGPAMPMLMATMASTVLSSAMAPKAPKLPDKKIAPVLDDDQARVAAERNQQRKPSRGREGTTLSGVTTLG